MAVAALQTSPSRWRCVRGLPAGAGALKNRICPCTNPRPPHSLRLQLPIIGIPSVPPTAGFGEISAYLAKAMDEDDAFLSIGRRISCSKGTCAWIGVALAGPDSDQYRAIFDEAAAAKRVRLPRRQRQEVNFGTACTRFVLGSAATWRQHMRYTPGTAFRQGCVTDDRPKSARHGTGCAFLWCL